MNENDKRLFLKKFVKSEKAVDELIVYTKNKFNSIDKKASSYNNEFIKVWEDYKKESLEIGCFNTLKKYLVQLQFPVKKNISKTEDYKNVTLRGRQKQSDGFLELNKADDIVFELYDSPIVGKVPVIIVPNEEDFTTVICALSNKNEPKKLPNSMGALFINGINNWDRIHKLKSSWLKKNPLGNWKQAFKTDILPNPYLFKDKLIVLSGKGYSGIKSKQLGISDEEWKSSSLIIRREHECVHLFTLQYYGRMANNIHDEIIADYAGITRVLGNFNKEWFLNFMGLEAYPKYRLGGRLQNYQQPISLSEESFNGLKLLVKGISETIANFDDILGEIKNSNDYLNRIKSICEVSIITMASHKGVEALINSYNSKNYTQSTTFFS
ncbi:DUF7005 family protein [Tenacibaculum aiptasiae]|uniref:DUF7005 family protein n=1 Tax=Tenacibaculum aiptasiae TaxID=426481 RepID=UPI002330ACD9|nr:hypothetical protein [Tenacibaculum aiptasiae]